MNYSESVALVDFLNERFRCAGMKPWYKWAVDLDWAKLQRWAVRLGYYQSSSLPPGSRLVNSKFEKVKKVLARLDPDGRYDEATHDADAREICALWEDDPLSETNREKPYHDVEQFYKPEDDDARIMSEDGTLGVATGANKPQPSDKTKIRDAVNQEYRRLFANRFGCPVPPCGIMPLMPPRIKEPEQPQKNLFKALGQVYEAVYKALQAIHDAQNVAYASGGSDPPFESQPTESLCPSDEDVPTTPRTKTFKSIYAGPQPDEDRLLNIGEWLDAIGCDRAYKKDMLDTYRRVLPELKAQLAKDMRREWQTIAKLSHTAIEHEQAVLKQVFEEIDSVAVKGRYKYLRANPEAEVSGGGGKK